MKYINFEKLLDYVEGTLAADEMTEVEQYLEQQSIDKAAIEGIRLMWEEEQLSRVELEQLLEEMNFQFKQQVAREPNRRKALMKVVLKKFAGPVALAAGLIPLMVWIGDTPQEVVPIVHTVEDKAGAPELQTEITRMDVPDEKPVLRPAPTTAEKRRMPDIEPSAAEAELALLKERNRTLEGQYNQLAQLCTQLEDALATKLKEQGVERIQLQQGLTFLSPLERTKIESIFVEPLADAVPSLAITDPDTSLYLFQSNFDDGPAPPTKAQVKYVDNVSEVVPGYVNMEEVYSRLPIHLDRTLKDTCQWIFGEVAASDLPLIFEWKQGRIADTTMVESAKRVMLFTTGQAQPGATLTDSAVHVSESVSASVRYFYIERDEDGCITVLQ